MNILAESGLKQRGVLSQYPLHFASVSFVIVLAAFGLSLTHIDLMPRAAAYVFVLLVYVLISAGFLRAMNAPKAFVDDRIDQIVESFNEVDAFFARSVGVGDIFRLVVSRMNEIVRVDAGYLYLLNDERRYLQIAAEFANSGTHDLDRTNLGDLAERSMVSRSIERDGDVIAIPLKRGTECIGVAALKPAIPDDVPKGLYQIITDRLAPLILSSIAYEKNRSNALTDVVTDLPNEKAFYLILENLIAETQRNPRKRPLAIVCLEIKDLDTIHQRFGHSAGDKALNLAVEIIKDGLRKMDFFARASNNEFLMVLPTATTEIAHEVMGRVMSGFSAGELKLDEAVSIPISIDYGWASFGRDGETAGQLLKVARVRRAGSGNATPTNVLWFDRESVA